MGKIFVEGIKIYAHHGCFQEETIIGTNFRVDVELDVDLQKAMDSDSIQDTVNYQTVFEVIKEQMAIPSKLLEHVSGRVIRALFERFERVEQISLKIAKLNPPLGGQMDKVAVQIVRKRNEISPS